MKNKILFSLIISFFIFGMLAVAPITQAARSPRYDIVQIAPMTVNQSDAQVGEAVYFSTTIKNVSNKNKVLPEVCYESTDGNLGCIDNVHLAPGDILPMSDFGVWTSGGTKQIWISWTQDNVNYYRPANSQVGTVNIVD
jgi:hypothetical protein